MTTDPLEAVLAKLEAGISVSVKNWEAAVVEAFYADRPFSIFNHPLVPGIFTLNFDEAMLNPH